MGYILQIVKIRYVDYVIDTYNWLQYLLMVKDPMKMNKGECCLLGFGAHNEAFKINCDTNLDTNLCAEESFTQCKDLERASWERLHLHSVFHENLVR